jgi:tetratricopeptide (TPR) repeat protein
MEPIADSGSLLNEEASAKKKVRSLRRLNTLTGLLTILIILVLGVIAFQSVTKQFEKPKTYYEEQLHTWNQILAQDPKNPIARTRLAQIRIRMGQSTRAVNELEAVVKDYPKYYNAYYYLGLAYQEQGRLGKAERRLLKALSLIADDKLKTQPAYRLAGIYEEQGKTDEAIKYYELAANSAPLLWNPAFKLAQIYEKQGDKDKALVYYEQAAKFNPDEKLQKKIEKLRPKGD